MNQIREYVVYAIKELALVVRVMMMERIQDKLAGIAAVNAGGTGHIIIQTTELEALKSE